MRSPRRGVCVLVSGGVESAAMLDRYLARGFVVHPLFVRCGFWWEEVELAWMRRLLRGLKSSRLRPLAVSGAHALAGAGPGHWAFGRRRAPGARAAYDSVYLPGRNLTLLSCAASLCAQRGLGLAAIGSMKGNPFPDATPEFFRGFERLARASFGVRLRVEAPFRRLGKRQVVAAFPGARYDLTFSCLRPAGLAHCGRCSKCAERREAVA